MKNNFPEKFAKDDGTLDADALVQSYKELEQKIGGMIKIPDEGDVAACEKFRRAIGVPESAADYPDDPIAAGMPEIKEKFREIGLTKKQADAVFKLAAEFLSPAAEGLMSQRCEAEVMKELRQFFGGDEKVVQVLAEINEYAEKNLAPEEFDALSTSAAGIKALYNMMKSGEPPVASGGAGDSPSESELRQMMRDPKYWRDSDPEYVRKIEAGFRRLYK